MADNLGVNPNPINPSEDLTVKATALVGAIENLNRDQIKLISFHYILGFWKGLVTTTVPDGKIFEVTYNKEKGEAYIDIYIKDSQRVIPIDEIEKRRTIGNN
jgi:hypothetical protein